MPVELDRRVGTTLALPALTTYRILAGWLMLGRVCPVMAARTGRVADLVGSHRPIADSQFEKPREYSLPNWRNAELHGVVFASAKRVQRAYLARALARSSGKRSVSGFAGIHSGGGSRRNPNRSV